MDGAGILLAGFDTRPFVAAVVVGVAFAGPLSGNRLFGTESSNWGICCLFLCLFPFVENDFCFVGDTLSAVGIVATAEVVVAVVAIVVATPLVVSAIDLRGAQVACCYNTLPSFAVVRVFEVVVASALRLFLDLLVPWMPSVLAAHLLRHVVPHSEFLPPRCPLFLAMLPLSIPPAHAGGLLNFLQVPVALPFLYLLSVGVLLRRNPFVGFGTSCGLAVSSPIPCNPMGIILTFVDLDTLSP